MGLHKAEIFFFVLLFLIGFAGISSFMAWSTASELQTVDDNIIPVLKYNYMSMVLTGLSIACSVLLIYPTIKVGVAERSRLRDMTASLSIRSETLEQAAVTDALTGLHNRRYFDDALREYLEAFALIETPVGMILLDLDHFKSVNDTYGHNIGDEVLREVALCMQDFTRYHDVVARLGGEEFAVLSPNITERQIFELAERIRRAIAQIAVEAGAVSINVTVSAGIAIWDGKETGEELYSRADKQLYAAKRNGRNQVCTAA
ncbi:GGDEF domain-containing protein [Pseudohoeflea suaedae]|uniref:diguanylate cyclase n=1 Tax=Pseudohoeflea suaedae TaxID=877384 RepID=A0A4R5PH35_9HYPH|nr:GGDEF domain-containing protein [Pseudohoeflea suaedae]TDH34207.1 GGDEF domain-containing protein [Pseudohoeflea suaedae]